MKKEKSPAYLKLFKKELTYDYLKNLSDSEFRLLIIFRALAGWDPKYPENLDVVKKTIRAIQKSHLPKWKSPSKASRIINQLTKKKIVSRLGNGLIKLEKYVAEDVLEVEQSLEVVAEQDIPMSEQDYLGIEQEVSDSERERVSQLMDSVTEDLINKGIIRKRPKQN